MTDIFGVAAVQSADKVGEIIDIQNIDCSNLAYINDEHHDDLFSMVGGITSYAKILSEKDVKTPQQKKCWNEVRKPFLFVTGRLDDGPDSEHPNAKAAGSLLKFCAQNPDVALKVGFSIEGGIVERDVSNKKILRKTNACGISLTVKPCHPDVRVFLVNDLLKSEPMSDMPECYKEALKKSGYTPSFKDVSKKQIIEKIETLKKSLEKFKDGVTSIKCNHCGGLERFFKSSADWPNTCGGCGRGFRMTDIYNALSKEK